jgi:hypothetical protein
MIGTNLSWRTDMAIITGSAMAKPDVAATLFGATLHGKRNAIASSEPEDAHLTGMTRSLDRRLLALNLKPVASTPGNVVIARRVA